MNRGKKWNGQRTIEVHPAPFPSSLEGDWTAHLKDPSPAEKEIQRHAENLGAEGHLFTSIGAPEIAASGLVTKHELREILDPNKKCDYNFDNEVAVTNLFFSEKKKHFFKFKVIQREPDADSVDYFLSFLPIFTKIFKSLENYLTIFTIYEKKMPQQCRDNFTEKVKVWAKERNINFKMRFVYRHIQKLDTLSASITPTSTEQERLDAILKALINASKIKDDCMLTLQCTKVEVGGKELDLFKDQLKIAQEVRKEVSDDENSLFTIPDDDNLIRRLAARESDKHGAYTSEIVQKTSGEIEDFYKKVIVQMAAEISGTLVYSVNEMMLQSYLSIRRRHRYEIDWTLFSKSGMFLIEVSDANQHKKVRLNTTYQYNKTARIRANP